MNGPAPGYPTSKIVDLWQALPVPGNGDAAEVKTAARAGSMKVQAELIFWPRWLLGAGYVTSAAPLRTF